MKKRLLTKGLEKPSNTSKPLKKRTKVADAFDPNMIFSFRQYPITQGMVDKMIEELPEWPLKNPKETSISEFYLSRNISERTYYRLLEKYPELKECHAVALERLGNRLYKEAVYKVADWGAVKHRLYNCSDGFRQDYEFHAKLKAESDKNANTGTQYIEMPVYITPPADKEPETV